MEEDPAPLGEEILPQPQKRLMEVEKEILVCHAGTCLRAGAEAVMLEIEELSQLVDSTCKVRASGCLGYCSRAPNAIITDKLGMGDVKVHTRLRSTKASAKVVEAATGRRIVGNDEESERRLSAAATARNRKQNAGIFKWNSALEGYKEQLCSKPSLQDEFDKLMSKAGFPSGINDDMPTTISNYTKWTINEIVPVSKHSAIFKLSCSDKKRGTPHPRGRSKMARPVTWHTTMLAEVGANTEGPLPWIERDYTPISDAIEWERGNVDLLIKIYPLGKATWWLHNNKGVGETIWLSQPIKTMEVPQLTTSDLTSSNYRPASIILFLAGTGVVALPQILAHRDPIRKLGIATAQRDQLRVPMDVVISFREDDVLLAEDLSRWCQGDGFNGIRNLIILVTPPQQSADTPPFASSTSSVDDHLNTMSEMPNVKIMISRIDRSVMRDVCNHARPQPCRIVVSGPGGFNMAVKGMLDEFIDDERFITVLAA